MCSRGGGILYTIILKVVHFIIFKEAPDGNISSKWELHQPAHTTPKL